MESDKDLSFNELEVKWRPLLNKFARWKFGMEYEDIYQELLLVLHNAQKHFETDKDTSFITYLYRACLNKVGNLRHAAIGLKTRIPETSYIPLCVDANCRVHPPNDLQHPITYDDISGIDALTGASSTAMDVALRLSSGIAKHKLYTSGLTRKQIRIGMAELKTLLGGKNAER